MIDFNLIFTQAATNILAGLIQNVFWILLFFWAVHKISKEIKLGVKEVPNWIEQYHRLKMHQLKLEWAKGMKT